LIVFVIQLRPVFYYGAQMWMNALITTEDAVNLLPVSTYLTVSSAAVIMDTSAVDLPAQV